MPLHSDSFDGPFTSTTASNDSLTVDKLLFAGAISFGSRALNVDTRSADHDFAMLKTNFDNLIKDSTDRVELVTAEHYFTVVPAWSTPLLVVTRIEGIKIDILLFSKKAYIDIVKKSIRDMQKLPKYMYYNKKHRRVLYQKTLLRNGFVHSNYCLLYTSPSPRD